MKNCNEFKNGGLKNEYKISMKRTISLLLGLASLLYVQRGYCQNNSVRINLAGLVNPLFQENEIRSMIPPTISLGFEHKLQNRSSSIGGQICYGYTPITIISDNKDNPLGFVVAYQGVSAFLEYRKYLFLKNGKISSEGLFGTVYLGVENLNENMFTNYDPSTYESNIGGEFLLTESVNKWIAGVGLGLGYKITMTERIYLETLLAMGYGFSSDKYVSIILDDSKWIVPLNLSRIEFSIGYYFKHKTND